MGPAAPLTQNSRLSAYSRQRRHLTASSRAIPTGAPPHCSSEPGTPWQHAHCTRTTRGPGTGLRGLSLIRLEPLPEKCVCSVRKNRIPLPARLCSAPSGSVFQQLGLINDGLQETSQQVVSYFPPTPPHDGVCRAVRSGADVSKSIITHLAGHEQRPSGGPALNHLSPL